MSALFDILRTYKEIAIFLTIALGFLIGRLQIGSFKVGPVLGCLFAGMLIGQLDIHIPAIVKTIFFDLFLFATGYKVGPQFFYGLKKDALPQLLLTVVVCTTCLIIAYALSKLSGYDTGTAAGLLAGAFSESTVIGTASDAIQRLSLSEEEKARLINNIPVTYAITFIIGTITNVWFVSTIGPKLLGINLPLESKKLEKEMKKGTEESPELDSAYREWVWRAFRLSPGNLEGLTVLQIESLVPDARILVKRIRRKGLIVETLPETVVAGGDILAVAARYHVMLQGLPFIGDEVHDKELLDIPLKEVKVTIASKDIAGKTLRDLARNHGSGIMLNKLMRSGQELPFEPATVLNFGDVLSISGSEADIARVAKKFGFAEKTSNATDLIFVGTGIVLGSLIGLLSVTIGGIEITLSTSGGTLLMGLVFGWLHARVPKIGHVPEPALWIFDTLGLATFLALIGIAAGPTIVVGLKHTGWNILWTALAVAILPHVIGLLFGKYVLKMNPVILLGAETGAGTSTPALKAVQEKAQSKIPVLGYTIPYAVGNIILAAWGPVIVSLMTR